MRVYRHVGPLDRTLLVATMFAVAAVSSMRAQRFNLPSSAGATVSVATLRIPEKAWKHFDKAKAAAARNRPEESDREIAQAIQIAPGFAEAYLLRADLQIKAHSFAQAIDSVAEARRTVPDIPLAGILLAGAYNGLRRYTDANLVLENLHGSEAQSWQANYERARAATGLQDIEAALRWSAKALEFAPQRFADVCLVRANALLLARRWSDAAIQLQAYLKSDGPLLHRDEASTALVSVRERAREEDLVNLASR